MLSSTDVEKKMRVFSDIGDIVDAMKAYAGAAVRRTESLIPSVREYEKNVLLALADVISLVSEAPVEERSGARRLLVAFGSSQGLCGAYNERMCGALGEVMTGGDSLFVIGRRLKSSLETRGVRCGAYHDSVAGVSGIGQALRECISQLMNLYRSEDCYTLALVYTSIPEKLAEISVEQILPPGICGVRSVKSPPLMHLRPEPVFEMLLEQYIGVGLYRGFLESLRSENWYRLRSMEGASDNIMRHIAELDSLRKYVRQEEITGEMLEILGGGGFFRR